MTKDEPKTPWISTDRLLENPPSKLLRWIAASALSGCWACSPSPPDDAPGGHEPAAGGTAGVGNVPPPAGTAGVGGTAGAGGTAGGAAGIGGAATGQGGAAGAAGGSGASGASGTGGVGGAALPAGCEELGTPGMTGRQCDPGSEGNGIFEQPEPDDGTPPEAEADPLGMLTEAQDFESALYGYGFSYRIYVPSAYEAGKAAALMIFQDGNNYLGNFNTPQVFDALIEAGDMPVTIGVFIQPGDERSVEYDTRSDKYGRFLLEEILPNAVLDSYTIVDDPNGWAIGGHSSGGACAFTVGWHFPDEFRKIMTHMGSFVPLQDPGSEAYRELLLVEDPKPLRVNLLSGQNDLMCCGDTWFNANNEMASALETAGYAYRYLHSTTTHSPSPWATADFPDALRWLWRAYTLPHYD